jgi:tryptophan 2-monooxygenase
VFVRLKSAYWDDPNCNIPQLFTTDTFLHDVYGYYAEETPGGGVPEDTFPVLLISYTWWRDATRLLSKPVPEPDQVSSDSIVHACVKELDRICRESANIAESILPYIDGDTDAGFYPTSYVQRWELKPYQMGAARLYDQREWNDTQVPMAYNQTHSAKSHVYFAGESYHVDAGWTEPAFRTAIDAVLYLCEQNNAECQVPNFNFNTHYPRYDMNFQPTQPTDKTGEIKS